MTEKSVNLAKEVAQLKEEKAALAQQYLLQEDKAKATIERLKREKDNLAKELKDAKKALAARKSATKSNEEVINQLRQQLADSQAQVQLLQQKIAEFDEIKRKKREKYQEELRQERASYAQLAQEKRDLEMKLKQVRWY